MSGNRGCVGMARETSSGPGLQPLRATVPFQLHRKTQAELRNGSTGVEKAGALSQVKIRRTLSSDAIVGPYLQGQWPRDGDKQGLSRHGQKDKFTQTSSWWPDEAQRTVSRSHRRSASWGNADHLRDIAKLKQQGQQKPKQGVCGDMNTHTHTGVCGDILEKPHQSVQVCVQSLPVPIPVSPLTRLPSPLRQSEERLDQELERAFKRHSPNQHGRLLEVPDGHRAPVPTLSCSSSSQSEASFLTHLSTFSSPCPSPQCLPDLDTDLLAGAAPCCTSAPPSPVATSPRPNKSYCFQREPPEGCERVPVCEENTALCKDWACLTSCPDPNKVNFTPHGGSAFCPVSLLKPLLPSVDFLFRTLSVSPGSCWGGQAGARQTPSPGVLMTGYLGSLEPATSAM